MLDYKKIYAFFQHLSKREKLILYLASGFILLTIMDRLIIFPVLSKMKSLDEELVRERADIKRDLHILAQKERILKDNNKYNKYAIEDLTAEEITTALLKEIENLGSSASVYLIDIKPTSITQEDIFLKYYVSLSCEAQMEQIIDFMYKIESSNNLLMVEKYNLGPKSEDTSIARCTLLISKTVIPPAL